MLFLQSFRKKIFSGLNLKIGLFFVVALFLFSAGHAQAATYYSRASTAWATGTTWATSGCGGSSAGASPAAGDTATICNGNNVSIGAAAAAATVTIASGGTLTFSGTYTLTLTGTFTNNGTFVPSTGTVAFSGTSAVLAAGTGVGNFNIITTVATVSTTLNINTSTTTATFTIPAISASTNTTVNIASGQTLTVTGTATITKPGSATGSPVAEINVGSGNLVAGTLALTSAATTAYANLTVGSGSVTVTGNLTTGGLSCQIVFNGAGTIYAAGQFTSTAATFTSYAGSTVNFNGTGAQTVPAYNYANLTLSGARGSNSVTLASAGTIGVSGTFNPSATFSGGGYVNTTSTISLNGTGAQTIPSFNYNNLIVTNSAGATASATVNIAGTLTLTSGTVSSAQNITMATGSTISRSAGALDSGVPTFSGTVNVTYTATGGPITTGTELPTSTGNVLNNLTINDTGQTVTLGSNVTINGAWALTLGTFAAGSNTIYVNGTATSGGTFTANTSTVNYSGTAQTALPLTYNNLTLSTSGAKTFATTPTVNGILSLEGTATIAVTSGVVTYGSSATLQYKGSSAQTTTAKEFVSPFTGTGGVIINNSAGVVLGASSQINYGLTLTSGALSIGANTLTLSGTITTTSGSLTGGATSNITFIDTNTPANTTLPTVTLQNLSITRTNGITLGGAVTVGGTLTLTTGTVTTASNLTMSTGATISRANGALDSGTPTFSGTVNVTYTGATGPISTGTELPTSSGNVLGTLTINDTGQTVTLGADVTVNTTLAITLGTFAASSHTIYIVGTLTTGGTFTAGTGTVNYNSSGAQSVVALTYNNLTISNAGNKTLAGATTLTGNFVISGSAALVAGSNNITFSGSASQSIAAISTTGSLTVSKTAGTVTLAGNVSAASLTYTATEINTGTVQVSLNGYTMTLTGAVTLNLPSGSSSGGSGNILAIDTGSLSCTTVALDGTTGTTQSTGVTISTGTLTASSNITGAAGTYSYLTFTDAGLVKVGGTFLTTGTFTSYTGSTVNYTGAGQTVKPVSYANLTLSGSGTAVMTSVTTLSGNFTMSGSVVTTTGALTSVGGNWSQSGTTQYTMAANNLAVSGTFTLGDATNAAKFTSAGALTVTINGASTIATGSTYSHASSGAVAFGNSSSSNLTVNGTLSNTAAGTGGITATADVVGTGTITLTGATELFTQRVSGDQNFFTTSGATNWAFSSLTFSNSNSASHTISTETGGSGTITVAGVLTVGSNSDGGSSNTVLNAGDNTWILTGAGTPLVFATTPAASLVANASTFDFKTASAQTGPAVATTFYTLKSNNTNASGLTLGSATTVTTLTIGDESASSILNDGGYQITSTGTLTLTNGTLTLGSGTNATTFPAFSTVTISTTNSTTVSYIASVAQTVSAQSYNNLSFLTGGVKRFASGTTNIYGTLTITTATADATTNSTTVNYDGAAQTLGATTYYNLTLSGSGTKTVTGVTTVNNNFVASGGTATMVLTSVGNNFTVSGAAITLGANLTVTGNLSVSSGTLTTGAFTFTIDGTSEISGGTLSLSSNTANKTFVQTMTVDGGTVNGTSNKAVFHGGITQSSGTFAMTGGLATFNTNSQALSGAITIPSVTVTGVTLTNNGTLTVATALAGTGTLVQGSSAMLNLGGTVAAPTTLTAIASNNTVNYNGATQNIELTSYYNLTLTTGADTFVAGTTNIAGSLSLTNGATVDTTTNTTTINYNGVAQTVGPITYYNLTLGGSGTDTLTGVTTINNNFALSGTVSATTAANMTVGGTLDVGAGTSLTVGAYTLGINGATTVDGTLDFSSAASYTATGGITVDAGGNLTDIGTGALTLGGNVLNSGTITLNAGGGVHCAGGTDSIVISSTVPGTARTWSGSGTFTIENVDVTDQAASGITITAYSSTPHGTNTGWVFDGCIAGITISGTVYDTDGTTALTSTPNMKLADGATSSYTATAGTDGKFSFTSVTLPTAGDVMTVWLDTNGGDEATLVFKYGSGCSGGTGGKDCTGLSLVKNDVIINDEDTGSLTNNDFQACNNNIGSACGDSDIGFNTTSGLALTWPTNKLVVANGAEFVPDGNVSAQNLEADGAYTGEGAGAGDTLNLSGSGTPLVVGASGVFTAPDTVTYTGSSATTVNTGVTYNNLNVTPLADNATVGFANTSPTYATPVRVETEAGWEGVVTFSTPTTAGELVVYMLNNGDDGTAAKSVTDNKGDIYTQALDSGSVGVVGKNDYAIWYYANAPAGVTTITPTIGAGDNALYTSSVGAHYTGIDTSNPLDVSTSTPESLGGQNSPWASPAVTTTKANELLVAGDWCDGNGGNGCYSSSSPTFNGNWTQEASTTDAGGNSDQLVYGDQIVSSIQTNISSTGTGGSQTSGWENFPFLATFKAACTSNCSGSGESSASWYPTPSGQSGTWQYRKAIVINHNQIASSTGETYANNTVASAGTISDATKNSIQSKMFFDGTNWWSFYMKSGTANTLFYAYSPNLSTWTESSVSLGGTVTNDGNTLTTYFDSATHTVLATYYSDTNIHRYMRGNISGTSITWSANTLYYDAVPIGGSADYSSSLSIDSNNKVWAFPDDTGANLIFQSTNVIGTSFADTAGTWNQTDGSNNNDWMQKTVILPLAGGNMLEVDVGNTNNDGPYWVQWSKYDGSVWSAWSTTGLEPVGAGVDQLNWGIHQQDYAHTYFVGQNNTSSLMFSIFNGTAWDTTKAQPTWPTSGLATNSQVAVTSDGTHVFAFVIRGDSNNTVSYDEYTIATNTWSGWQDMTTTAQTRSYITAAQNTGTNGQLAVLWTQVDGSNYDIVAGSITPTIETYTNFPVLVSESADANLAANASTTGADILFTKSDGTTKLNHEIENYNSSTGELEAWVNVGASGLSTTTDTTLYMYYGNASSPVEATTTAVWDSNYKFVWHLGDTSGNYTDSTSNGNTGVDTSTIHNVGGEIGDAAGFDGVSSGVAVADNAGLDTTSALTASAWVNQNSLATTKAIINKWNTGQATWSIMTDGTDDTKLVAYIASSLTDSSHFGTTASGVWSTGWHYVTLVYNGAGSTDALKELVYIDGVNQPLTFSGGSVPASLQVSASPITIGTQPGYTSRFITGTMDEARVSNTARSADWIATEYNNQSATSTFYSVSAQQASLGSASTILTITNAFSVGDGTHQSTVALPANMSLAGAVNINSGTLDLSANNNSLATPGIVTIGANGTLKASRIAPLYIENNFINNGTFTHNGGTVAVVATSSSVTFGGTHETSFYNFIATSTSADLKFQTGAQFDFSGLLNLVGTASEPLFIDSSDGSSQWLMNLTGTQNVQYVSLSHAGCSANSAQIPPSNFIFDRGGNSPCWGIRQYGGAGASFASVDNGNGGGTPVSGGSGNVTFNNSNDPSSVGRVSGGSLSASYSVTPGGTNTMAFACVVWDDSPGLSVGNITYGGQTMTPAGPASYNSTGGFDGYAQVFYLPNPPTGSNTLSVSVGGDSVNEVYANLVSFNNVNQTTPIRSGTYQNPNNAVTDIVTGTYSMTVSSNPADLTMTCVDGGYYPFNNSLTETSDGSNINGTDQEENDHSTTPASSVTHTWGTQYNQDLSIVGFSIQPPLASQGGGGSSGDTGNGGGQGNSGGAGNQGGGGGAPSP